MLKLVPKEIATNTDAAAPTEDERMTRTLHRYVSEQINDGVPIIDVIVALENTLQHVETLRKIR